MIKREYVLIGKVKLIISSGGKESKAKKEKLLEFDVERTNALKKNLTPFSTIVEVLEN